ncbi:MAG TPA: jacalin-like lectin [Thermoanaerobaculia bacterium]|jgi:hypothetical protein|nr:jacalin-like lectin [Thermoanaerobaculia bacterium]
MTEPLAALLSTTDVSATDAPPVALFQGYDTFMSAGRSTAVKGTSESGGATAETYYQVCYDYDMLQTTLNVSSSVSASFGFGSVDAKAEFIESLSITTTSVTIIVYTNILSSSLTATNVELADAAPTDINAFFQVYGDSYLNSVVIGAEYAAAYVFYSQSIEQQRQITSTLAANGISASGSLNASLQTSLNEVQQQVTTRQSLRQFMSGFTNPIFPTSDQIINFALSFGAQTPNSPAVIDYQVTGYEHVPGMAPFTSVVTTRTLYNGVGSQDGLADDYATLSAVKNAVLALQDIYVTYGYTGDVTLSTNSALVQQDIKTLDTLFHEMDLDPTLTYSAPSLPALALGTPELSVINHIQGPWGGNGGEPFGQVTEASVSESLVVSKLSLRGDRWVDQLAYTYQSDAGTVSYTQGGNGGDQSATLQLQSGERLASISGWYGTYVNQITIETSYGNSFTWPSSPDQTTGTFSWKAQESTVFLGFAGRSGRYLDALSLVTATFAAARWVAYDGDAKQQLLAASRLEISATAVERERRQRERRLPAAPVPEG